MKLPSILKPKGLYTSAAKGKKSMGLMLVASVVAVGVAMFAYKKYGVPKIKKVKGDVAHDSNKEIISAEQKATIYYFYTEWCPYCKKARPEWNKFKSMYENKTIKGHKLEFVEVDCDKDEATATQFNVESYPTIKLVKGGSIIEYDAKPKFETLKVFVESSL